MSDHTIDLLTEAISTLECNGKTSKDVLWIGKAWLPEKGYISWDTFAKYAKDITWSSWGSPSCDHSIIIVGKDFWLELMTGDTGGAWFEYKSYPTKPDLDSTLPAILNGDWLTTR